MKFNKGIVEKPWKCPGVLFSKLCRNPKCGWTSGDEKLISDFYAKEQYRYAT